MRFYIKNETAQEGPFDLVAMVRKIRSGSISPDLLVLEEHDEVAVPAGQHPQLHSFFREMEIEAARVETRGDTRTLAFVPAFKRGIQFLIANHFSAIYGAVAIGSTLLLFTLLTAILPSFMSPLSLLLSWIFLQFSLGILLFMCLRLHRGQTHDLSSVLPFIRRSAIPLAFCSALVGIFSVIGSFVLIVPGIVALALYSFAPLLIIEQNYDFWDAMELSRKTVMKHGRSLFEVVFGFAVVNVLAGALYGLPLAVALPITFGALAEIFDELDFQ